MRRPVGKRGAGCRRLRDLVVYVGTTSTFLCLLSLTWLQWQVTFQAQQQQSYIIQNPPVVPPLCDFPATSPNQNDSHLFFNSCRFSIEELLHKPYRLNSLNLPCSEDGGTKPTLADRELTITEHLKSLREAHREVEWKPIQRPLQSIKESMTKAETKKKVITRPVQTRVKKGRKQNGQGNTVTGFISSQDSSSQYQDRELKPKNAKCLDLFSQSSNSSPPTVNYKNPCLKAFIQSRCFDHLPVPKVVHYVWFSNHSMDVVTLLSVLAAYRFLDPCLVLFHADSLPQGPYWFALVALVPVLVHVKRQAPDKVFGKRLGFVQHKSDIARLEALEEYGGIYLDGDQIVLKSLDEFRRHQFVMGHENARNLANSLIVSQPGAHFIDMWFKNYRSYNPKQWGIHSTFLPLALARIYPKTIHNAGYAFVKPDLSRISEVWEGHHDWSENYAIHLYHRSVVEGGRIRSNYTLEELTRLDSALGQIARHVVFGDKNACVS